MNLSPYLFFDGRCEEAVNYYTSVLGAEVRMLMRFSDAPPSDGPSRIPPGSENRIMHVALRLGANEIMASDGMCSDQKPNFDGFSLSLRVPDVATAERIFGAIAADGQVRQPLTETFFASRFGMVADKFGVGWMVIAEA